MNLREQIDLLQRFENSSEWSYVKSEMDKYFSSVEVGKNIAIRTGNVSEANRLLGWTECKQFIFDFAKNTLESKKKIPIQKKLTNLYDNGKVRVQKMLSELFEDSPQNAGD